MVRKSLSQGSASADEQLVTGVPDAPYPLTQRLNHKAEPDTAVSIHPLSTKDGVIISVKPPREPTIPHLAHVPCDIVLVLDVSGSMESSAVLPTKPGEVAENLGLSILDLVKHASRTILASLNEGDRLAIVTFSSSADIVQPLEPMTDQQKETTKDIIEGMQANGGTNLWGGIHAGLEAFDGQSHTGRVPALMVLTDGDPTMGHPSQGYISRIQSLGTLPAAIHTFGFGYTLWSGLLKSIAEVGGGNYAFIPDAGMIGTVFVHAVANLQSTFANNAFLRVTYPRWLKLEQTTGIGVDVKEPVKLGGEKGTSSQLELDLGNIQYGQSRDIYLRYSETAVRKMTPPSSPTGRTDLTIQATLEYNRMRATVYQVEAYRSIFDPTDLTEEEIAYHVSRSLIVAFINSLFPINTQQNAHNREREAVPFVNDEKTLEKRFSRLIKGDSGRWSLFRDTSAYERGLPARHYLDAKNQSLMRDLMGEDPEGQVGVALGNEEYWNKWGKHYLLSLANAHARQLCNSFKDPGPLQYGTDSPLFQKCRDYLDFKFDTLPAPKPSKRRVGAARGRSGPIQMSGYNRASNPCFAGFCKVRLANGQLVNVSKLRSGAKVETPKGTRRVLAILKTRVARESMVKVGGLVVTPWHPISRGDGSWMFPKEVAEGHVRYTGSIYSLLLQRDTNSDAHAVMIGGLWGVTLGHGITVGHDARAHCFLGDYKLVTQSISSLGPSRSGVFLGGGVTRDRKTGQVRGFKRAQPLQTREQAQRTVDLIMRKVLSF